MGGGSAVNLYANILGLVVCLVVFAVIWVSYFAIQKRITVSIDVLVIPALFVAAAAIGLVYIYLYLDTWVIAVKQAK